jgi:predicted TIM-barrel fold metal-dependent hydrolase
MRDKGRRATVRNDFWILDADAHQMEPAGMWADFLAPEYRSQAPLVCEVEGNRLVTVEGEPLVRQHHFPFPKPHLPQRATGLLTRVRVARFGPTARLADMDAHGVDVQILFPTVGGQLLGREFRDPALLAACCRAYNRWSREYAAIAPTRLRWVATLPLQAVDLAIEEARRAATDGAVGFYVRPTPVSGRNLSDPAYEPLWGEIATLGLPVCLHDASSPRLPSYGERMTTHTTGHILSHPFEAMGAMVSLIWDGVVERFPTLRFVHVEADAGWLPYWLQRMEQHYELSGNAEHPSLTMSPTCYFRRNFFVACRGDERTLPSVVELLGDDRLLFSTDYPHSDATWPAGLAALESQPIAHESVRRIFWDNGAHAFGLEPPGSPRR